MTATACPDENGLLEYVEGLLPAETSHLIDTHIDGCASCRRVIAAFAAGSAADDRVPDELPGAGDRYELHGVVGTGAMSVVYAATDRVLDRKVAFKVLRDPEPEQAARLQREAQAMAKLAHPNVVPVHDVGVAAGRMFLTAELVSGCTLAAWLAKAPRTWREIVDVFVQAGRGLAAAHAADIAHRDFKPSNVLVGDDGRVRVADFGLARRAPSAAATTDLARSSAGLVGTPIYMAPEQLAGATADARSDQFSFCVALCEALYGARPFAATDLDGLRAAIARGPVIPNRRSVPRALRRIVLRGLATDPAERHPSIEAVCAALVRVRDRPRRIAIGIGASALVVVVACVVLFASRRGGESECRAPSWSGIWDPVREVRIAIAFAATRSPGAEAATRTVSAGLAGATEAWSRAYVGACEARRVRSARVQDLAMACLADHRARLQALTDVLIAANATVVTHAALALDQLGDAAECGDARRLLDRPDLPADPHARETVAALRAELARARALQAAGKPQEALALAIARGPEVKAAGYRPLDAELAVELGTLYADVADAKHAEATLLDAIAAAQAAGDAAATATAATQLARVLGDQEQRFAEAHRWTNLASGAVERLGGDRTLAANLAMTLGALALAEGDAPEARAQYRRARGLFEQLAGDRDARYAIATHGVGLGELRGGNAKAALVEFDRARALLEPLLGPWHPRMAELLGDRASALRELERTDEAERASRDALAIREAVFGRDNPLVAATLLELAGTLQIERRFSDALPVARRARAIWERTHDEADIALALTSEGLAELELRQLDTARDHLEQALAMQQHALGDDHPDLEIALRGLVDVYARRGDIPHATVLAQRARTLAQHHDLAADLAELDSWLAAHRRAQ
jgi:tRNA A-37 threonylcarbamoyl transferase component Bud32/tetratricopeptide (TPR) repeat protein